MKIFFPTLVIFLLSFSLVTAVDVSTTKTDYNGGDSVSISINACEGTSIVKFLNPSGAVVDIKAGEENWSTSYNTLSDSADGKYTVTVTCNNGNAQANFCVDAPSCAPSSPSSSEASTSGGSGGSACSPNWNCGDWSYCGPGLTQTRSCTDKNNCQKAKEETRPCETCLESWVCSLWAQCNGGSQARACYDEHLCQTIANKPALQKQCNAVDPLPPPTRISTQLPPPFVPSTSAAPQEGFFSRLWNNYSLYFIALAVAIILAALIIFGIYYFKPKKVAYNINELKQWVRKEKEMGTSNADIRQILKQNTGWTDQEIDMAFEGLQQPSIKPSIKVSNGK